MTLTEQNKQRIQVIRQRLETAFQPDYLNIEDDSHKHIGHPGAQSGAGHFSLTISAPVFNTKSRLQAHRLIYAELNDLIPDEVHALKITLRGSQAQ